MTRFLLRVALAIAAFFLMVNVLLPWAAQTMTDGFLRTMERQESPAPSPTAT